MENHDVRANPRMGGRAPNPIRYSVLKIHTVAMRRPFVAPFSLLGGSHASARFSRARAWENYLLCGGGKSAQECGLTGFCFFAGIPKFLTITTSLLGAPA